MTVLGTEHANFMIYLTMKFPAVHHKSLTAELGARVIPAIMAEIAQ
jgi:hypothetical protein